MRPVRAALSGIVLAGLTYAAARPIGPLPALGALLDPANGVWAVAGAASLPPRASASVPGLGAEVRVVYDARGVPHIFAATEADAYRALGYVVARDRLFQLELQARAASGRLTEVAGARALELDQESRRLGMPRAAERKLASVDSASASGRALVAYADGVNAYIDAMPARELPVEYRLLGVRPLRWTPIQSLHLMNRMGYTLAYIAPEIDRAAAASRVGAAAAAALFPEATPIQEPIQPNGQQAPRLDFAVLPPPAAPDAGARQAAAAMRGFFAASAGALRDRSADADDGRAWMASNNWAVAPGRTRAGRALLAGDPHLELTLPSIWYEAHLVVPGRLDVYGVTIPGAPAIIIGFNRDVAWTFTNTGADVLDFYRETVDDEARPTRYRVDGAWRTLERRVETYRDARGATIATDTLLFTHRGPMRRTEEGGSARWVSMRWTVLEPSNEMAAFQQVAHARTVAEFQDAMGTHYRSPAQNMLAADRAGSISIRSTGRFPVRPDPLGGLVQRDGSLGASDWRGDRPVAEYPQSLNPAQGFLASANQQPVDPRAAPGYWGGSYDPWRAMRINALLRADSSVTPDAMRRYQTDPGSERANLFVPRFLAAARQARGGMAAADAAQLDEAARLLAEWDRRYTRENTRAVLFEAAMRELAERTWDELIDPASARDADRPPSAGADRQRRTDAPPVATRRVATPSSAVLAQLLADSASIWWDDTRTAAVREDRDAIVAASLVSALGRVRRDNGEPDAGGWQWSRVRHANVNHLLALPGFGERGLSVQGGPSTLSPSGGGGTHGASWRMVVELGPEVTAWAVYPGGQSGNPASPRYADRLASWQAGRLDSLVVPRAAAEMRAGSAVLTLTPRR